MFRDRTNLYISFRQSYAHRPHYSTGYNHNVPEEQQGLMGEEGGQDNDMVAVEMDLLPPRWVDISDEVDNELKQIREKLSQLDTLHKKNALPGFDDRSKEEQEIEQLTYEITTELHRLQTKMKRFDEQTQDTKQPAEQKMAANMKISMATKIQEVSTMFRKMQSNYLKSLRNDSQYESGGISRPLSPNPYSGTYDPAIEEDMDVSFSERALQQSSQLMDNSQDQAIRQREQEINKIAQGILEIADIFKDLQTMVIDQGTLLDRIDYNIETMYTNVKHADKELVQAQHYQKRTQKCKIILLLCLLIAALIIILIIKPKRHHNEAQKDPAPARPTRPPTPDE